MEAANEKVEKGVKRVSLGLSVELHANAAYNPKHAAHSASGDASHCFLLDWHHDCFGP